MRRFQKTFLISSTIIISLLVPIVSISEAQLLPTGPTVTKPGGCEQWIEQNKSAYSNEKAFKEAFANSPNIGESARGSLLGCAIKTGKVRLFMIPFFITYLIEFLLSIAGLVAVLFMVIGGYKYVVGGLTEDKESGKKTILHALVGFIVALSAWIVVNFIQVALTS